MGILHDQYNERINNGDDPEAPVQSETLDDTEVSATDPEQHQPTHTFSANTEPSTPDTAPAANTPNHLLISRGTQKKIRSYIGGLVVGGIVLTGIGLKAANTIHKAPTHPQVGSSAPYNPVETSPSVDPTPTETPSETPTTTATPELPAETTGPLAKYEQETTEEFAAHPVPEHLFYSYTSAERITNDLIFSDWFGRKFPDGEILGDYAPPVKNLDATSEGIDIARQGAFNRAEALGWMADEDDDGSEHAPLNYAKAEKLAYGATLGGSKANRELLKEIKNADEAQPVREYRLAFTVEATTPLISIDAAYDNVNLKGKILTVKFPADPAAGVAERIQKDTYAYVPDGYGKGKNAYLLVSTEHLTPKS